MSAQSRLATEVLNREQSELVRGRSSGADVAETVQRCEQLKLDLVTKTSDVITTERRLRDLLNLPPSDNRRIVPVTRPFEELVNFDWETCLAEMNEQEPEIILNKLAVAELSNSAQDESGREELEPEGAIPSVTQLKKELRESLQHQGREKLQQAIRQQTHSLARMFLEVDAGYKYQAGTRVRGLGKANSIRKRRATRGALHYNRQIHGHYQQIHCFTRKGVSVQDHLHIRTHDY